MKTGDFVLDILHEVEDYTDDMESADAKEELLDDLIRNLVDLKQEVE